ncbi:MAG: class I SAM-dependent methyltransferase [Candidatus Paceibacterota bacterium]
MPNNYLEKLKENWNELATEDALWAILSDPEKKNNKWQLDEFFKTGEKEILDILEKIKSLGLEINYGRCLDFGCGVGRLTQSLGNFFQESIGVDISEKMIELARSYNVKNNCYFFVSDNTDLSLFPDNYFDFIYSNITFQHIHPTYALLYIRSCLKKLASNGIMVFQVTTKEKVNIKNYLKKRLPYLLKMCRTVKKIICKNPSSKIEMYIISPQEIERIIQQEKADIISRINQETDITISSLFFIKKI